MAIVLMLRRNVIKIANLLLLQWSQLTKTVYTARLGLVLVFCVFFRLHYVYVCLLSFVLFGQFPFIF